MEKITAGHPLSQSEDIVKQNLETLKTLFPTIVKEGKVDIEELKALLGDEVETGDEFYRFTWAGKNKARQEANKPSTGTLRPNTAESKDWDTTQNIFIEGDNLEVLKLLQKSYGGRIKMIYIDPPYNTGNDFVYKDNYADNLANYLAISGQADEEGRKLSTNTESDGRYHSNWLNMMYPRLKLARNLLKNTGVIFISIDENEYHNLRKLCDEIFGEENFIATFIWKRRQNVDSRSKNGASVDHEYILSYSRLENGIRGADKDMTKYANPDNDPKGDWMSADMTGLATADQRPNLHYDLIDPKKGIVYKCPPTGWRYEKSRMAELLSKNEILFPNKEEGRPRRKKFSLDLESEFTGFSTILNTVFNTQGTRELRQLFDDNEYFDFPKPKDFIVEFLKQGMTKEDTVLDFFAGSGTSAHATMQLNAEDNGTRKFICVQLPEKVKPGTQTQKAGYNTIADVTKDRIRKAGDQIKSGTKINLFNVSEFKLDIGFKSFKLDTSNLNSWDGSVENFERNIFNSASNIKEGRTEDDILYEVLLKTGLDLSQPIDEKVIAGKKIFSIGLGALFICLADNINTEVAEHIGQWKAELEPSTCRVIFKDSGFTDVDKTNSVQVLKRYGITEVNSI
ncbi:site-specific DNA-methyltransferase [Mucilaginibacter flavidus]|uniref:site-specific DNA-methyltransferase n=1 Tax=Mucilaginibacter flavidus TaxID=2949309 RepID=UPI002093FECF|nr:site-specific DNA-methyltransferase [Mucilaginibacter flavidus]MCO5948085.1 site-specific DNA-methyltransferase [Mucilaginibacter flavidus]